MIDEFDWKCSNCVNQFQMNKYVIVVLEMLVLSRMQVAEKWVCIHISRIAQMDKAPQTLP